MTPTFQTTYTSRIITHMPQELEIMKVIIKKCATDEE
jgi:hypothetical protein